MDFWIGNIRCFAQILGQGSPLLCLHGGFGLDHTYFRPYLDALANDHQLIFLDMRGHGRSMPLDASDFRFGAVIEDIEAIREQLGLNTWAVLGHSGGSVIAAQYAATHPHRVNHLVLLSSFPHYPFPSPDWFPTVQRCGIPSIAEGIAQFQAGIKDDATYAEAFLKIAPLFFADPSTANAQAFEQVIFRVNPYNEVLSYYPQFDVGPRLTQFRKPTLVLHGTQDYRTPLSEGRRWLQYVPHAMFQEVPATGHFPFIEQPTACTSLIGQFLRR